MEHHLPDPNQMIEYLRLRGIKQIDIIRAMGIEKGMFNSWRNSSNKKRRQEMSERIYALYEGELSDLGGDTVNEPVATYLPKKEDDRYVEMLEETIKDLKQQNEWLRKMIDEKSAQIKELLQRQ